MTCEGVKFCCHTSPSHGAYRPQPAVRRLVQTPRNAVQVAMPVGLRNWAHYWAQAMVGGWLLPHLASCCPGAAVLARLVSPPPPPPAPSTRPGVVKQHKSSRGSVDTTKPRSDPQRVGMCSGERPIGAAKGKQTGTMASCQPPPPNHQAAPPATTTPCGAPSRLPAGYCLLVATTTWCNATQWRHTA